MPLRRKRKEAGPPFCTAVVAAAGSSSRMQGEDKQFSLLAGRPVLAHTLLALERCPDVQEIIVVTREDRILDVGDLCRRFEIGKAKKVVRGGATRTESVLCGALEADGRAELLAIQDGARPLVTPELISATIREAARSGAAAPAIPVRDTIKEARDGLVLRTPDRSTLFAVQTPQVFEASLLKGALKQAREDGVQPTDDCMAVERLGMSVRLVEGDVTNLKITVPSDLVIAEALLKEREET